MSDALRSRLVENLRLVHERMEAACHRGNRSIADVTLVAVSKYAEMEWVQELVQLGVTDLGEARPQQLMARAAQLPSHVRWHLIGHLQRNKAEGVLASNGLIHSVDSVRLFDHIAKLGAALPRPPRLLLEVNISGEASKDGFIADDLLAAWSHLSSSPSVEIAGLMTMAPLNDDSESARPVFRALRELRDRLRFECDGRLALNELSMGMSGDFEVGIEEGATLIRVGSSLFEGLS
ncbi:YggS family pyridoxal phosphate-dependent enzyme [Schlesneria paludicola]|uniref:YggS family pyridoxal phosphate-dependent enzyme n=1 Tax=Schlesneria paludicola TaxID=360056 RepID=UPI000492E4EC|nr:YggS family pyridoxal phosphate-dependent enzyme [Schlesneria paludicola]